MPVSLTCDTCGKSMPLVILSVVGEQAGRVFRLPDNWWGRQFDGKHSGTYCSHDCETIAALSKGKPCTKSPSNS